MNMYPASTNFRSYLMHAFFALRTHSRREALWAKLMGRNTDLALFPDEAPEKSPNRRFIGTEEIRVEQIVGTLNRRGDFDHKFRPINKHLCERWVNVHIALERDGWPPILVHKVGENYYVEDGHHRVSIAQALGMTFIPAKVWDYPCLEKETHQKGHPIPCPELSPVTAYAGVSD